MKLTKIIYFILKHTNIYFYRIIKADLAKDMRPRGDFLSSTIDFSSFEKSCFRKAARAKE